MDLDIKKALNSPFSDEKWYIKLIFPSIMAIFSLISNNLSKDNPAGFLGLLLITLIPGLILSGLFVQFANNEIHGNSPLIPNLSSNIKTFLKYGAKLMGAMLIYGLVFSLIGIIIGIVLGIIFGIIAAILNIKALITLLFIVTLLPVLILLTCFLILAEGIFFDNFNFKETLNYKKAFKLLTKVKSEIGIYLLFVIGFGIIISIISAILKIAPAAIILASVPVAIIQFISVNFKAQIYKIAKSRMEDTEKF